MGGLMCQVLHNTAVSDSIDRGVQSYVDTVAALVLSDELGISKSMCVLLELCSM